jgi:adenylate cyclase
MPTDRVSRSPDLLTEAELARRSGASPGEIERLAGLGILQPDDGRFPRRDVMRVRVVAHLAALGIPAEALGSALASGHLSLGYLESAGRHHPRAEETYAEAAERIGLSFATLARIYVAFGLLQPKPDERVLQEDLEVLTMLPALLGAGIDETQVLRLARVWGDSARRVAQYLTHYFHATVEEQFRRRGLRDNAAYEAAIREVGLRMGRSGEDLLGWLFRRHSEVFMTEHQLGHVETALDDAGVRQRAPRQREAVVFADLSGYTRLTEEAGDEAAAEVSLELAQLVNEAAAEHGGNLVKLLGDGAYLHFRDPADAIRTALAIVEGTAARGLPPAHVGVNAGPLLYDEGDYFGRTVNVAARIGAMAGPGQVYVGEEGVDGIDQVGFTLVDIGRLELKGIAASVGVLEAVREA